MKDVKERSPHHDANRDNGDSKPFPVYLYINTRTSARQETKTKKRGEGRGEGGKEKRIQIAGERR